MSKVKVSMPGAEDISMSSGGSPYVSVGRVQIPAGQLPTPGEALQTLSGQQPKQGPTLITLPEFLFIVGKDPAKANSIVPGIAPKGVDKLAQNDKGQVCVPIPPDKVQMLQQMQAQAGSPPQPTARQQIDAKFAESRQLRQAQGIVDKAGGSAKVPEFIHPDQFAKTVGVKSFADISPHLLSALMPGIDKEGGALPWIRQGPDGDYVRNPQHPKFRQTQQDVIAHQKTVASDE